LFGFLEKKDNGMKKLGSIVLATGLAMLSGLSVAAPSTYTIENGHTYPRFEYNHLGFSNQVGRFDKTSGQITLDVEAKTGSVDVTIETKSLDMGSALFNEHLSKEEFFHTAKYPTITFKSTKLAFEGEKLASVEGNLTIKGITKPVTLKLVSVYCGLHPIAKKEACGANATAQIKRSEFNMSKYVPFVSDEVTLTIPVEALKQ
jgi:polyisoprenoid-binding protein YceI